MRVEKILNFVLFMENKENIITTGNSKGAAIFKKMLEDKKAIHEHIAKGKKISELKTQFNFVTPLSFTNNN
jgi:uncharacterized membrane-anchored protein YhcB (DUF1043 family)